MQFAPAWTRLSGFHLPERQAPPIARRFAARLRTIKVFRAPRDVAMFTAVTTTYWLVAATVWHVLLFALVRGLHETGALRLSLTVLTLVGVFVVINEAVRFALAGHGPAIRAALEVLIGVLGLAAVAYWLDDALFAALIDLASNRPLPNLGFIAGNLFLLGANVALPALGGAFILRLIQGVLAPKKTQGVVAR